MPELEDFTPGGNSGSQGQRAYLQRQDSQEFRRLKSKLQAAGVDASGLCIKPLKSISGVDSYVNPPCFNVFVIPAPTSATMSLWNKLRQLVDDTGYYPVINRYKVLYWDPPYGDPSAEEQAAELEETIQFANGLNVEEWFEEQERGEKLQNNDPEAEARFRRWIESAKEQHQDPAVQEANKKRQAELNSVLLGRVEHLKNLDAYEAWVLMGMGPTHSTDALVTSWKKADQQRWDLNPDPWPAKIRPSNEIGTVTHSPKSILYQPELYVDLFPTTDSWRIPMYSQFPPANNYWGGGQSTHMAILKRWQTEYGAELVVHAPSNATYELRVLKPPTTKEAAIKLAVEHYLYCEDCVTQTTLPATIKARAASILNASTWYFWWD
jgi:hypothetical protein